MSDAPIDRAAVRRRARAQAQRMGLPVRPDPDVMPADADLPTDNLFALRGLLITNRLTPAQAVTARKRLAAAERTAKQAPDLNFPED